MDRKERDLHLEERQKGMPYPRDTAFVFRKIHRIFRLFPIPNLHEKGKVVNADIIKGLHPVLDSMVVEKAKEIESAPATFHGKTRAF